MTSISSGREAEVYGSLDRVGRLLRRGVLAGESARTEEGEGIFTLVLIHLADTMAYLRSRGLRASFLPGTEPNGFTEEQLTDFILYFRNIACHVTHGARSLGNGSRFVYGVIRGGQPDGRMGNVPLACEHPDDVAFLFGETRIYLERHIEHAFRLAVAYTVERLNWIPPVSALMPRFPEP